MGIIASCFSLAYINYLCWSGGADLMDEEPPAGDPGVTEPKEMPLLKSQEKIFL